MFGTRPTINALNNINLDVMEGETLGLVGESGSGKTTLSQIIMGLDSPTSGQVVRHGVRTASDMQIVFQDPNGSLDPRLRVNRIIAEPLRSLRIEGDHDAKVAELVEAVGLPAGSAKRYPHELSGGQRQRVAIARALAPNPRVLIADEPVSALDVSVRAKILNLIGDMKDRFDLTVVMVSHDLSVMNHFCDRIAVMHDGEIVELRDSQELFEDPHDPYTKALLSSNPTLKAVRP